MRKIETTITDLEKLVEDIPLASLDHPGTKSRSTKKRVRRIADPHIRPHKVKGYIFYTFCRGVDQEIYLGSAEAIYKAVMATKLARSKQRGSS